MEKAYHQSENAAGFVVLSETIPDLLLDIRYYSTFNFIGDRIEGYRQPLALMTREAAQALAGVSRAVMARGFRLKVFDAYRPQQAVDHFMRWADDPADARMKAFFYPGIAKERIIPDGFIARHSGHSRGSTVDLTLFDMERGTDLDMGGPFDFFGPLSHYDYPGLTEEQRRNRRMLREVMTEHGFRPLQGEWWHFTLEGEPYPDTYFTFPVEVPAG